MLQRHSSRATEGGQTIPKSVSHPSAGSLICLTAVFLWQRSALMMEIPSPKEKQALPSPTCAARQLTVNNNKRPGKPTSALAPFPLQHLALGTTASRRMGLKAAEGIHSLRPFPACFMPQKPSICHGSMASKRNRRGRAVFSACCVLIDESDHGILWLFVTGNSFSVVSDCRGVRINGKALCDEPEQMTFLSSPCLFHATQETDTSPEIRNRS